MPVTLASVESIVQIANELMFSDPVLYVLLATGLLFTIWSGFGQYRAMTHGVGVVRGKYDRKDDPGAINHFQALSAALSATVGLGNIGGVAIAVALGGPGAVFWMWVIGFLGMSLKMVEVTQTMLYRNTDDPDNPHGGPMFVVRDALRRVGMPKLGWTLGAIFCVTLLISAITGGNMYQAWNVADTTHTYFGVPKIAVGIILAVLVSGVILGGIKRIGSVAGRLVPMMCALYLLAACYVLSQHLGELPGLLVLIVRHGVGLESSASPTGSFIGGSLAYAMMWGVKRALFSSEAGQGSAPIAHAAAKCNEPVREGVVAGLEPFIDTIVVCTLTALVILSSGAWNRGPEAEFASVDDLVIVQVENPKKAGTFWTINDVTPPERSQEAIRITGAENWSDEQPVFVLVEGEDDADTSHNIHRLNGTVKRNESGALIIDFDEKYKGESMPTLRGLGLYPDYAGSTLTAHAFDRTTPGLGKWLITIASWLFAISTMISWSYYGEQGIYFIVSSLGKQTTQRSVLIYKIVYCLLIVVSTLPFIRTTDQLDMWTSLGLGVMLIANIPIMLVFGGASMKAYHQYIGKLKRGEFHPHEAPPMEDVISGKDVE